ncbi:toxin VasX [Pseudorhodoferax sp.]|uniref:toxin VasX n=1 Tax=Pseudorhodoferax sp. TaxID=1993553 RepID=UPI0039E4B19D
MIAIDPEKHTTIWLAYSRYRWTQQVLDDYRNDKDGRRTARMTPVNVTAAAKNDLGAGKTVPHGAAAGATTLPSYVADFTSVATQTAINKTQVTPLRNRAGQAAALAQKMAHISRHTPGKTGCLIVLNDPVNNVIELGASRDETALKVAQSTGLFDRDGKRARARIVAEAVEAVRKSAEENPGPWYDRNYGPDRFMKHVKQAELQTALQDSKDFNANLKLVDLLSADYVAVKESTRWKDVQRWDFDATDDTSALDHGQMVADSVRGAGVTKLGRR